MATEDTIDFIRKNYSKTPNIAFSMIADVLQRHDECLREILTYIKYTGRSADATECYKAIENILDKD